MPIFSVIMIFKDPPLPFFEEAIASVEAQTLTDWELLLVDDGSRNGAELLAQTKAAGNPAKIRVLAHPRGENRGMSASRNLGIDAASGALVCFLDADDVWLPHRLATHHEGLAAHPGAALAVSPSLIWRSWQATAAEADAVQPFGLARGIVEAPTLMLRFLRDLFVVPAQGSVTIRRQVLDAGFRFEASFRGMFEDQVFWVKTMLDHAVFFEPEVLFKYRQHPTSEANRAQKDGTFARHRRTFLRWVVAYLQRVGAAPAVQAEARATLHRECGVFRVLYLSSEFAPRGGWGGITAAIREAAVAQIACGDEVHVLACGEGWPTEDVVDEGIVVHRRPLLDRSRLARLAVRLARFRDPGRAWRGVSSFVHAHRLGIPFDVVETPEWLGEGWLFALRRFAPLVTTLHTPEWVVTEELTGAPSDAARDPRPCAERLCAERADAVVSPSALLANRLTTSGWLGRTDVGIEPYAKRAPATASPPTAARRVLFCGHIDRRKAPDVFLRAFALVRRAYPDATALLHGRDTSFGGRSYVATMRAAGVPFEGATIAAVERTEVAAAIAACRVFVLPARFDNYPLAVLEAMAGGRPVVVSDRVGMAEMVRSREAGTVVAVDDVHGFARAIESYVADAGLAARHGENGRRAVAELLDPATYVSRRDQVYAAAAARFHERERSGILWWAIAQLGLRATTTTPT